MIDRPDRIRCSVFGCRRTAPSAKYPEGTQIICGKCWRLGSKESRAEHTRWKRAQRRYTEGSHAWLACDQRLNRAWAAVCEQASEARVGIG